MAVANFAGEQRQPAVSRNRKRGGASAASRYIGMGKASRCVSSCSSVPHRQLHARVCEGSGGGQRIGGKQLGVAATSGGTIVTEPAISLQFSLDFAKELDDQP